LIQNLKYLLSEPVTGLLIGIGVRMFVFALQVAGSMAAQAMSLSQVLGGAGEEPLPAIGYVLTTAGVALAFVLDLHVKASVMLISSFQIIPPGSFLPAADLSQWGVGQVVSGFSLAFRMAAPFLLVAMLYNLMLGVINRAMPQLMVAFVGAPLITFGGLALLFASSAGVLALWNAEFTHFLSDPFGSRP
jgi:flagellar biosynthetic protein FliR